MFLSLKNEGKYEKNIKCKTWAQLDTGVNLSRVLRQRVKNTPSDNNTPPYSEHLENKGGVLLFISHGTSHAYIDVYFSKHHYPHHISKYHQNWINLAKWHCLFYHSNKLERWTYNNALLIGVFNNVSIISSLYLLFRSCAKVNTRYAWR